MKYIIVDAIKKECRVEEHEEFHDAVRAAGLDPNATDHGSLRANKAGIVVYEYGMFEPKETQHYFQLAVRLYAGNALVYGVDEIGETTDAPEHLIAFIRFFDDWQAVEDSINRGKVYRPQITVNGSVSWHWPEAAPQGSMR